MARWRSSLSSDCTPRSRSGDSVGEAMPICASDRYVFGSSTASSAPTTRHAASGAMNHHLRRLNTET